MGRIMRKNILLSFSLLLASCLCACHTFSDSNSSQTEYLSVSNVQIATDASTAQNEKCGVNGVSCNDSALINYTKTEADYKAYGERAKRDHLYTQASAGNNLTATVRPDYEYDVVTEYETNVNTISTSGDDAFSSQDLDIPTDEGVFARSISGDDAFGSQDLDVPTDEGIFARTAAKDLTPQNTDLQNGTVGHADNVVDTIKGPGYEIVCEEECSDFAKMNDSVTSEFTEDSFDIADYIESNGDEEDNFEFEEVGDKDSENNIKTVKVAEIEVNDSSILVWDAKEGDNLRELLTAWSKKAGWKLLWNTNRNYVLSAGAMFKGKFTDVSSALVRAFARARPAPIATYYKGNRVIVVETMENENAY